MELAYSGLHQLCAPMMDRLDRLPVPQRDALATVFGLSAGVAPDRFLVGLATLTLFAEVAEQQPLVCIVDDAQWLDHASAQILGFVARRLHAERIAIVCAARTGVGDERARRAARAVVEGLGDGDARALLLDNVHGPLDAARLRPDRRGEPRQPARAARAAAHLEPRRARRRVRVSRQPAGGRQDRAELRAASPRASRPTPGCSSSPPRPSRSATPCCSTVPPRRLGLDMAARDPAVEAGLLKVGARVEFAHPLVRSAAYRSAPTEDRHRVHRALADATDPETDPDRRAWHRARGTPGTRRGGRRRARAVGGPGAGPRRARGRGRVPAARGRADRGSARRGERALAAAQANLQAGAFDAALGAAGHRGSPAPLDELPTGAGRPRACAGRLRVGLRQRRAAVAADRRQRAGAVRPGSRTRDLPGGLGRRRDGRSVAGPATKRRHLGRTPRRQVRLRARSRSNGSRARAAVNNSGGASLPEARRERDLRPHQVDAGALDARRSAPPRRWPTRRAQRRTRRLAHWRALHPALARCGATDRRSTPPSAAGRPPPPPCRHEPEPERRTVRALPRPPRSSAVCHWRDARRADPDRCPDPSPRPTHDGLDDGPRPAPSGTRPTGRAGGRTRRDRRP